MPASLRFLRCLRVPGQTLLFHRCASAPRLLLGGVPLSSAASRWVSTHDPCVFASAGVVQSGCVAQRGDAELCTPDGVRLTGMFDRFSRLVKANVNEVLNKAEDPEKMLNQIVEDMQACSPDKA